MDDGDHPYQKLRVGLQTLHIFIICTKLEESLTIIFCLYETRFCHVMCREDSVGVKCNLVNDYM